MELRINNNGSYINLNSGPWYVEDGYVPQTPESKGQDSEDVDSSGGERYVQYWRNVTDSMGLIYVGTQANFEAAIQDLNRVFLDVSKRQGNRALPRIYLEYRVDAGTWYRTEILQAKLQRDAKTFSYPARVSSGKVTLAVHRRFFWEQVSEVTIPLRSFATAKTTAGVLVHSHWDSGHQNWVEILAADVAGDMETPVRLKVLNSNRASLWFQRMHIGHNVYGDPANLVIALEGENCSTGLGSNAGADTALWSNGAYRDINNFFGGPAQLIGWTLNNTLLTQLGGHYYHILARIANPSNIAYCQFQTTIDLSLTSLAKTGWIQGQAGQLQDFGSLQFPPFEAPSGNSLDLTLLISYRATATISLDFDYLLLVPTESFAQINQLGYSSVVNDYIIDDNPEGRVYGVDGATGKYWAIWTRQGTPIELVPNKLQRLYFSTMSNGGVTMGDAVLVTAYYRPRKLVP